MKTFREFAPVPGSGVMQPPLTPHVKISHSLLIRMFEYFLENEEDLEDSELHEIAETIFEIGSTGTIVDTSDYDYIVGDEAIDGTDDTDYSDNGWYEESADKVRTADEIKRKIVSKHAGHFPAGRPGLPPQGQDLRQQGDQPSRRSPRYQARAREGSD